MRAGRHISLPVLSIYGQTQQRYGKRRLVQQNDEGECHRKGKEVTGKVEQVNR